APAQSAARGQPAGLAARWRHAAPGARPVRRGAGDLLRAALAVPGTFRLSRTLPRRRARARRLLPSGPGLGLAARTLGARALPGAWRCGGGPGVARADRRPFTARRARACPRDSGLRT